jgi:hypothetical protein
MTRKELEMPVIGGQENDVGGVAAADAVVSVNVLNETEAGDHALMEHFFRAPRRAEWPLVLVSERIMHTNTAAATLVQSADHNPAAAMGSRRGRHKRFRQVRSLSFAEGATNREAAARLLLSRHTTDFHLTHCLRGQAHAAPW